MLFDPNSILNMQVEGAFDTSIIPVPEGQYTAVVQKIEGRMAKLSDGSSAPTLRVTWQISDPAVAQVTGREVNTVVQDIWLDVTESGALDTSKGKNTQLGRLREAVGQNQPGKPWAFSMLVGKMAQVLVTHRTDDSGTIYAQVKKVSSI